MQADDLPAGFIIATKLVAEAGRPVCFLYREVPESEEDSGWRVFSGEEDQAYADDPANLGLYAVSTVVAIDPSIAPLLRTPAPCAFERESPASPFCATDFGFEPEE